MLPVSVPSAWARLPRSVRAHGLAAAVLCAAALTYAPSLFGDWVWDDQVLVVESPDAQSFGAAFGSLLEPHWAFEERNGDTQVGYWRPLTKFEQRGLKLGHGVWDLLFKRSSRPSPSRR